MLSVTFNQPIVIDAANLHSLLSLANTPAVVAPYASVDAVEEVVKVKRVRIANGAAAPAVSSDKPKRTRATKAEMEARRAAAVGEAPANVPAITPPNETADTAPAPAPEKVEAAPVPDKPKRDRRSAAQKAAAAAKEAAPAKPTATPAKSKPSGGAKPSASKEPKTAAKPTEDSDALLARFAALIDKDYPAATALLEGFGVKRFSEMDAKEHPAFSAKLKELGV